MVHPFKLRCRRNRCQKSVSADHAAARHLCGGEPGHGYASVGSLEISPTRPTPLSERRGREGPGTAVGIKRGGPRRRGVPLLGDDPGRTGPPRLPVGAGREERAVRRASAHAGGDKEWAGSRTKDSAHEPISWYNGF